MSGFNNHPWARTDGLFIAFQRILAFFPFPNKLRLLSIHQWAGKARREGGWGGFQSLRVAGEGDSASAAHLLFQSPGLERDSRVSHQLMGLEGFSEAGQGLLSD